MDSLQPVLQPITRVWRGLGRGQQIGLAAVAAALVGLLFIVSTVGHGADSAIAYSGLSNDDEAAIVQKLKDAKIPYELHDGGTIRVPSGQLQEARLAPASSSSTNPASARPSSPRRSITSALSKTSSRAASARWMPSTRRVCTW